MHPSFIIIAGFAVIDYITPRWHASTKRATSNGHLSYTALRGDDGIVTSPPAQW